MTDTDVLPNDMTSEGQSYFLLIIVLWYRLQSFGLKLGFMGLSIEDGDILKRELREQVDHGAKTKDSDSIKGDC